MVPGLALHVVQRGNNRQAVFFHESDYLSYLDLSFESAERYEVSVHAFVCMTNHVHILLTPWAEDSVSRSMQRMGALYTLGINALYHRSGSLWEGRFKSSLVDSERYPPLLDQYKLQPTFAASFVMPRRLRDCPSGYAAHIIQRGNNRQICCRAHALGHRPKMWQPHAEYLALGQTSHSRQLAANGFTQCLCSGPNSGRVYPEALTHAWHRQRRPGT